MHKKPIYGGRINCDHGNRNHYDLCLSKDGLNAFNENLGAAQNMDLFLHTHPLFRYL